METNLITIKPETASHEAEQFSGVPLPFPYPLPCFIPYSKAKFACYSRCFLTSYFCIPVPYNEKDISLPRRPFPIKSLALSAHVSPQTIHFRVLDKNPLSGLGRGPPSCNNPKCRPNLFPSGYFLTASHPCPLHCSPLPTAFPLGG